MRIISLAPSNTEIIFRLGGGDRLVATTSLCDHPEGATDLPSVGGWTDLDVDKVAELAPDIALASDELQDEVVDDLRGAGVEVKQFKPRTVEQVFSSIRDIGELLDRKSEAENLVEEMRKKMASVDIGGKRVYCEEWSDPPMVSGNWVPGLFQRIGGCYPIAEGERSRKIGEEEIREFDPEYIFVNVCGAGENASEDRITDRDGWKTLDAVRNGDVYVIDDSFLNRPGPRLIEGVKEVAGTIADE